MKKTIITVTGKDQVGIIGKVCTRLADRNINILDISQTVVDHYFNMLIIADRTDTTEDFLTIANELSDLGKELGLVITCQRDEIFEKMHRI